MKIFIPEKKDPNPYLDEIINFSEMEFIFDSVYNFKKEYDIINVHWPEALFDWIEPSDEQLKWLQLEIRKWKITSKLIYTRHDHSRNMGRSVNFDRLFKIIEKNADVFVHLGDFSKVQMEKVYPNVKHVIIPHPLYKNSFALLDKAVARERLEVDQESLVVIAPGRIRNTVERKMVLKAFNALPTRNKVLISNNMLPFEVNLEFLGRTRLKKIFDINIYLTRLLERKYSRPKYVFNYGFCSFDKLSLMMAASDIVLLPRRDILNSGNFFLGLTFNKLIVGPASGNIKEHLVKFGMPVFNPSSSRSVSEALKEGIEKVKNFQISERSKMEYEPARIAREVDNLFQKI